MGSKHTADPCRHFLFAVGYSPGNGHLQDSIDLHAHTRRGIRVCAHRSQNLTEQARLYAERRDILQQNEVVYAANSASQENVQL